MDTFLGPYFHFCLELVMETRAKASLTHPLISELSIVRDLRPASTLPDCPYKGRGVVSVPICANKVRIGPANANQGCSTASQGSRHVYGMS